MKKWRENLGRINHVLLTEVNAESQPLALYPQSEAISRPSPKSYRNHLICAGASPSCSAHRGASMRCFVHAAMPLECAAQPLRRRTGASPMWTRRLSEHLTHSISGASRAPSASERCEDLGAVFPTIRIIAMKLNKV